ncbi:hypothetical protein CLU79DRAFT_736193 [Phycomyces nitens]|nr:hypothetical protein CLU79DRAFT_736193 [Phycomyces nitens]
MWLLYNVKEDPDQKPILLKPGKSYMVGRNDADISFTDKSISRKHASISVDPINHKPGAVFRPEVVIKDIGSKYGTMANGESVKEPTSIEDNTIVKFGSLNSAVKLLWKPLVICRASVGRSEKEQLAEAASQLGFRITKDWDDSCTHLYVKEIRFTHKLIQCLVQLKPVVSSSWLAELMSDSSKTFPDFESNAPPLSSDFPMTHTAPNFLPLDQRTRVFNGLIFYIFGKDQFDRLSGVIEAAGGKAIFCRPGTPLRSPLIQSNKGVFVIPTSGMDNDSWTGVEKSLRKTKREAIREETIGWSIVYCSLEKIGTKDVLPQPLEPSSPVENTRKRKATALEEKPKYIVPPTNVDLHASASQQTQSGNPLDSSKGLADMDLDLNLDQDQHLSLKSSYDEKLVEQQASTAVDNKEPTKETFERPVAFTTSILPRSFIKDCTPTLNVKTFKKASETKTLNYTLNIDFCHGSRDSLWQQTVIHHMCHL